MFIFSLCKPFFHRFVSLTLFMNLCVQFLSSWIKHVVGSLNVHVSILISLFYILCLSSELSTSCILLVCGACNIEISFFYTFNHAYVDIKTKGYDDAYCKIMFLAMHMFWSIYSSCDEIYNFSVCQRGNTYFALLGLTHLSPSPIYHAMHHFVVCTSRIKGSCFICCIQPLYKIIFLIY